MTVAGLVAVVSFHAAVTNKLSGAATSGLFAAGISDPVVNRDLQMLGVITVMLVDPRAAQRDLHDMGHSARRTTSARRSCVPSERVRVR